MTERLTAALLFAAASVLFCIAVGVVLDETGLVIGWGVAGTAAAALVAAWVAPRLSSDARNPQEALRGAMRGVGAGAVVTLLSTLTGALLYAVVYITYSALSDGGVEALWQVVAGIGYVTFVGVLASVTYFSPAILFGAVAGAIYYHLVGNSGSTVAEERYT